MASPAIRIEGLGKKYRVGERVRAHDTLVSAAVALLRSPLDNFRRLRRLTHFAGDDEADIVWALRDVSVEVGQGEVVGVIGHNGAGKSTLLKILSRITTPSTGRAELFGRVGSLLEVGTGFHPDLTGRENLYLNGAILGMTRVEIDRRFDEIVAFAEVDRFLDTPVKRYSSGMKVRLAFAVAAHLEPEILLIDEVLAVGDAAFQRKCLGKMSDVAGHGRTIFFVSHNMAAVRALCGRVLWFDGGRLVADGPVDAVADRYLSQVLHTGGGAAVSAVTSFCKVTRVGVTGGGTSLVKTFGPVEITVEATATTDIAVPGLYVALLSTDQQRLAGLDLRDLATPDKISAGETFSATFRVDSLPLLPGQYLLEIYMKDMAGPRIERLESLFPFEIAETPVYGARPVTRWHGIFGLRATASLMVTSTDRIGEAV